MAFNGLLTQITRPARYTGNELNSIHRDWDSAALRIVLVFPDTYEVGQSGLGLKILYSLLGTDPSVLVERAYAPGADAEEKLREHRIPLLSLESGRPLKDFDLIGFTLPYELTYTNVLNILELAGIPFDSRDRDDSYPLIAGGGSCVFNPEPVADFFDFLVLGEGEEVILEITAALKEWKKHSTAKTEALNELARIEGIYVPRFYSVRYDENGRFASLTPAGARYPASIRKRVVSDFNSAFYPTSPVIPYVETVHDRIMLEIFRGCSRGCRFCQAGMIYRPVRERSLDRLMEMAKESIRNTGYEEISLTSLSCSDYSCITRLTHDLLKEYEDEYLEISLPSLRIDSFSLALARLVQRFRRTTLTFAPEVGTQKMRNVINKGGSEEDVLKTMQLARQEGWKSVKLYFLIGLPEEEEEDVAGITKLAWKILQATGLRMNISLSSFIPKAWTPFQWDSFESMDSLREKASVMKRHLRHGKIQIAFHDPQASFMEAVFARGDRRLSRAIIEARRIGARFDGWNDYFDYSLWIRAFEKVGIEPSVYAGRRDFRDPLPWDHMGEARTRAFLLQDRERAGAGEGLMDCRSGRCNGCGACNETIRIEQQECPAGTSPPDIAEALYSSKPVERIRVKYTKEAPVALLSHLDLIRTIQRALRRAGIPVGYSEGFHPRMRIHFGPALSLGYTSMCEWMDIDLRKPLSAGELTKRLNEVLPGGIRILEAREIPLSSDTLSGILHLAVYRMELTLKEEVTEERLSTLIGALLGSHSILVQRKEKPFEVRPLIKDIQLVEFQGFKATLRLMLRTTSSGSAKPGDVLDFLKGQGLHANPVSILREGLYTRKGSEWVSP